jgi:hypothetical protein
MSRGKVTPDVEFDRLALVDGDDVAITVTGLHGHAGEAIPVEISGHGEWERSWAASVEAEVDETGTAHTQWAGVSLGRETALVAEAIKAGEERIPCESGIAIANPSGQIRSATDARDRWNVLTAVRTARYDRPLGDANAPGVRQHRAVTVIESLYTTTELRLPGLRMLPCTGRSDGSDERALIDGILSELGWDSRVPESWWRQAAVASRPWTVMIAPMIWARDNAEAAELVAQSRSDLIAVLGLNRGSRGRPVVTVIEGQTDDGVEGRIQYEGQTYRGNLAGGFISGESQLGLIAQHLAMRADPLLHLCTDLYSEALEEISPDSKYFRHWSILETLSGAKVEPDIRVRLIDGSWWPNGGTTGKAAPRVYRYLADWLDRREAQEGFIGGPNLFDSVNSWCARRIATAHYGRFRPGDTQQVANMWYAAALRTTEGSDTDQHALMRSLERTVGSVLKWELIREGLPLLDTESE